MTRRYLSLCVICLLALTSLHSAQPFWLGADISGTTELEAQGIQLYNQQGEPRENTILMTEYGIQAIRLRVWVNPVNKEWQEQPDGQWVGVPVEPAPGHHPWCSPDDMLEMALRAQALHLPVMIDFHYSDWWADPGKQNIPEAWKDMSYEEMRAAAADHTRSTLQLLSDHQIDVRWVQIGNETTHGFLWPMARAEEHMDHYAGITDTCYAAVKEVYPDAICIVHLDCGSDLRRYRFIFDGLEQYHARYDMIGMSMYPYWDIQENLTENENETLEKILMNIQTLYSLYHRPTMITEIGYLAAEEEAGYEYLLMAMRALRDKTNGLCHGVFYWAPELEGHYPLGAFRNHRPTKIMQAFLDL